MAEGLIALMLLLMLLGVREEEDAAIEELCRVGVVLACVGLEWEGEEVFGREVTEPEEEAGESRDLE